MSKDKWQEKIQNIEEGFDDGRQRLRIGKYRIIFKRLLDGTYEIIYIMDIGSRGDIYK